MSLGNKEKYLLKICCGQTAVTSLDSAESREVTIEEDDDHKERDLGGQKGQGQWKWV